MALPSLVVKSLAGQNDLYLCTFSTESKYVVIFSSNIQHRDLNLAMYYWLTSDSLPVPNANRKSLGHETVNCHLFCKHGTCF